jgi:ferredoxin
VRIRVDRDVCDLHGQCVFTAPAIFSFDDAGELLYRDEVGADEEARAQDAASVCPTGAIEVER